MIVVVGFVLFALLGAVLRWQSAAFVDHLVDLQVGLLVVNVVGSIGLGYLVAHEAAWLVALGTGGLGTLTSVSSLASGLSEQLAASRHGHAGLYLGATLLLGVGGAWLGLNL